MRRRRRSARYRATITLGLPLAMLAACWWWLYAGDREDAAAERAVPKALTAERAVGASLIEPRETPEVTLGSALPTPIVEEGVRPASPSDATPSPTPTDTTANTPTGGSHASVAALMAEGVQALDRSDLLAARRAYGLALAQSSSPTETTAIREALSRIGGESVFSPRMLEGDPLVDRYVIQPGDSLAKIATQYAITADLIASINGIPDKNRIRAGQTIKVIKGPFRAQVDKKSYMLDLFLGDVLVRSYPVGLGADGSTPTGEWQVSTKLVNPTYYPPRGGDILSADDPLNPLGERWIGLVGLSGEALGQERYGIHGTIEPESIGRNASMGCIRLLNHDVEGLYACLVEKHSVVTVK